MSTSTSALGKAVGRLNGNPVSTNDFERGEQQRAATIAAQQQSVAEAEIPKTINELTLGFEHIDDIEPPEPMIDGLLYKGTLAQLAGPAGSGKTFLVVGLAVAVAARVTGWQGYKVNGGNVYIVAAEGSSGLRGRIRAACQQSGIKLDAIRGSIFFRTESVQLGNVTAVDELIEAVKIRECTLVVFDTRALCTVGLNENDAAEQGKAINAALRIIRETGATVLIVHHNSKNGTQPRGSSAWDGQVWSDLRIEKKTKDGNLTVHVEKHKDARGGGDHPFRLIKVELDGDYARTARGPIHPRHRHTLAAVGSDDSEQAAFAGSNRERILKILAEEAPMEGLGSKYFETEHGIARSTFGREINILVKQGAVIRGGPVNRSMYRLP